MKTMLKFSLLAVAAACAMTLSARAQDTNATAGATTASLPPASTKTGLTYTNDILPIFKESCLRCHDSTKPRQGGKLSLDTLDGLKKGSKDGKVITVGDSAHSDLVLSIAHIGDEPNEFMPRGRNAKKLTDEQIGLVRAWIDQGAK
jgi:mono/diheme cytochrome c family protein